MQSRIVARRAIAAGPQPGLKEWNGQLLDPAQKDGIRAALAPDHVVHGLAQGNQLVAAGPAFADDDAMHPIPVDPGAGRKFPDREAGL
jgi:hypothetical protein